LRLILRRVRQRTLVLKDVAQITAIDPAATGWATDEMLGLVLWLLADAAAEISGSWDHFLGGSLWTSSGHSLSMTMRISSEMIAMLSISMRRASEPASPANSAR
jgi:hypothetical protein